MSARVVQVKKTTQFSKVMSAYCKKVRHARDQFTPPRASAALFLVASLEWVLALRIDLVTHFDLLTGVAAFV